jgi:hypothetical protein
MDRIASAVSRIDAGRVFVLAFGIGTMLAKVQGGAVPTFNPSGDGGARAIRSYASSSSGSDQ